MNNKAVGAIVLVVILGAAAFFYFAKPKVNLPGTTSPTEQSQVMSGLRSISDLISEGIPQKCTYSTTDGASTTEGTTYVSGKKVRGDFSNTLNGSVTMGHMISDGETTYVWNEGEKQGLMMPISNSQAANEPNMSSESSQQVSEAREGSLNQKANYSCSAWVPDDSMFVPPTTVKFIDLSEIMMTSPEAMPGR